MLDRATQEPRATCRDFSLMLCSVLRHHGVPARIRCGFGRYFAPHPFHDH
ncbi:transglutaminase domain-containing protein [Bradyrhizobium sp. USDA 3315]